MRLIQQELVQVKKHSAGLTHVVLTILWSCLTVCLTIRLAILRSLTVALAILWNLSVGLAILRVLAIGLAVLRILTIIIKSTIGKHVAIWPLAVVLTIVAIGHSVVVAIWAQLAVSHLVGQPRIHVQQSIDPHSSQSLE